MNETRMDKFTWEADDVVVSPCKGCATLAHDIAYASSAEQLAQREEAYRVHVMQHDVPSAETQVAYGPGD